jgi:DNA-binding NtrC family response regulator
MYVLTKGASDREWYALDGGRLGIGRSKENTIVLHDSLVSRQHAELELDGESVILRDLGGKNPIRVNGREVDGEIELGDGDRILIGQTELLVELGPGRAATPLRVVPDRGALSGAGGISLDSATVLFGQPDLSDTRAAEKDYKRLSRLYRFSEEILSVKDEEDLFDVLLAAATTETGAERGFVGLVAENGDNAESDAAPFHVVRFWNPEKGGKARTLEMSETILNRIQRERKAVLVRDVPEHQDFGMSVIDLQIRSFICSPLLHRDRSLGMIYVDTRGTRRQFDRGDLEFVSALGRMAGMSLESLRVHSRLQRENERLRSLIGGGEELLGSSEEMKGVLSLVDKVAPRDASVLIAGENGTGKELVARAIHQRSSRKDKPFVAVNCAAIPPNLVESELFGHERGSFTGAHQTAEGKFDLAHGGTLFLDEIGEMPLDMQVKILRALQERRFYRVGGKEEIAVDIRVVSATNRDLQRSIEEGSFREDLYFRLAVVTIKVPPLRERGDDVLEIAEHLLNRGAAPLELTKAARECLRNYHWPGNVRELCNVLEQAVILGDGERITPSDLPPQVRRKGRGKMVFRLKPLEEVEQRYIEHVLEETEGNKARAAEILGISRETLYQKLKQYRRDSTS